MADEQVTGAPPSRPGRKQLRNTIIQIAVALVIVFVIFGLVLPQVIDYEQVWETIKAINPMWLVVLVIAGLLLYVPEGALYSICLPGMSFRRGVSSWVASTAAASTTPGVDVAVRYGMGRSYGGTVEQTVLWIPLTGIFDNIVKFSLPVIAIVLIAVTGEDVGVLIWFAAIAAAVLAVGAAVVIGVFRSERFAMWLGALITRVANRVLGWFKKGPIADLGPRVASFREYTIATVSRRWPLALLASAAGKFWQLIILVIALRAVEIPSDVLSFADIFIVWALVMLITSIPITPGGIGIAELFYIGFMTYIAGEEWSNTIAAGVALYRLVQWAMPIVIGWVLIWYWRRQIGRGELPDPFAVVGQDSGGSDAPRAAAG